MRPLHTIGHSTHPADLFAGLLRTHGIATLADVRSVPRSRHNPQFDREALAATLQALGIGYVHLPALGGMRRPRPDSVNLGLRSAGLRGYADHMQTDEFRRGLERLEALAAAGATAIMCAEAEPSRCHRALLSDALLARGWRVLHIRGEGGVGAAAAPARGGGVCSTPGGAGGLPRPAPPRHADGGRSARLPLALLARRPALAAAAPLLGRARVGHRARLGAPRRGALHTTTRIEPVGRLTREHARLLARRLGARLRRGGPLHRARLWGGRGGSPDRARLRHGCRGPLHRAWLGGRRRGSLYLTRLRRGRGGPLHRGRLG